MRRSTVRGMVLWRVRMRARSFNRPPYVRFGVNDSIARRLFSLGSWRLKSR